jgi:hypothetical protein
MNDNFKKDYTDAVLQLHNTTCYGSETWVKRQRGRFTWNFQITSRVALLHRKPYEKQHDPL